MFGAIATVVAAGAVVRTGRYAEVLLGLSVLGAAGAGAAGSRWLSEVSTASPWAVAGKGLAFRTRCRSVRTKRPRVRLCTWGT